MSLEHIQSPQPYIPLVMTYDAPADLAFEKKVQALNNRLQPVFYSLDQIQALTRSMAWASGEERLPPTLESAHIQLLNRDIKAITHLSNYLDTARADIHEPLAVPKMEPGRWVPWNKTGPREIRAIKITPDLSPEMVVENVSSLIHDFRQPLAAVKGNVQLAARRTDPDLTLIGPPLKRLIQMLNNWEGRVRGEYGPGVLNVTEARSLVAENFKDLPIEAWVDHIQNPLEKEMALREAVIVGEIPHDIQALAINLPQDWFSTIFSNVTQNLVRQFEMKDRQGSTGPKKVWVDFNYDPRTGFFSVIVNDNATGWDPRMDYQFKMNKSYSGHEAGTGIGMAKMMSILVGVYGGNYILSDNEFGGATQVYQFRLHH